MTTSSQHQSVEQMVDRLRQHRAEAEDPDVRPVRARRLAEEMGALVVAVAERIYDAPADWGLDGIPERFRDDAAQDALVALLEDPGAALASGSVTVWFGATVERRFQELWGRAGRGAPAPDGGLSPGDGTEGGVPALFREREGSPWDGFERQFPSDAFVLRLRYVVRHTPEEMVAVLDAPSADAVDARLTRARGRLLMFFEQAGYDRGSVSAQLEAGGTA